MFFPLLLEPGNVVRLEAALDEAAGGVPPSLDDRPVSLRGLFVPAVTGAAIAVGGTSRLSVSMERAHAPSRLPLDASKRWTVSSSTTSSTVESRAGARCGSAFATKRSSPTRTWSPAATRDSSATGPGSWSMPRPFACLNRGAENEQPELRRWLDLGSLRGQSLGEAANSVTAPSPITEITHTPLEAHPDRAETRLDGPDLRAALNPELLGR